MVERLLRELPGQRCGLPQIVLNDIDEAITDVRWAAENGFTSVMIPHVPPDSDLDHYFTETYDPLWAECQELGIVLTQHGGTGVPSYKGSPATPFLLLMEVPFSRRNRCGTLSWAEFSNASPNSNTL